MYDKELLYQLVMMLFYPLEFANQAIVIQILDTKEYLFGLSPVLTQMAVFYADNKAIAWEVVKARPWEAVGLDLQKGPRSLAYSLKGWG